MICFSVDNPVSLENVESKVGLLSFVVVLVLVVGECVTDLSCCVQWMDEIIEVSNTYPPIPPPHYHLTHPPLPLPPSHPQYCQGVKLVLVALKCDLRDDPATQHKLAQYGMHTCQYEEGLAVARRVRASRYLGAFICLLAFRDFVVLPGRARTVWFIGNEN